MMEEFSTEGLTIFSDTHLCPSLGPMLYLARKINPKPILLCTTGNLGPLKPLLKKYGLMPTII